MSIEIERKFLIKNSDWKNLYRSKITIIQGYLNSEPERTVRIRIIGEKGVLTIKGKNSGIRRAEFEYEIPPEDANALIQLCEKPLIEKVRYYVDHNHMTWEIDEFHGDNSGLIIAEIELKNENQEIKIPDWIGEEVSGKIEYYNSSLIKNPYKNRNP